MNTLGVVILFSVCALIVNAEPIRKRSTPVKLPEYMSLCIRSDPEFNKCVKDNVQTLLPKFSKGVPEFDLDSLDPFVESDTKIEYKRNQVTGKMQLKNTRVYGLSGVTISDVRSDLSDEKFYMEIDFTVPRILMEGNYKGEGRFNGFVLNSKGYFNMTLNDVVGTWKITGEPEIIDGDKYIRIVHLTMRPAVGDMKVYMSDIFPGNDELNEAAVSFMNEYWPVFYQELLPYAEQYWDKSMTALANKVFLKVPYDQLFPVA